MSDEHKCEGENHRLVRGERYSADTPCVCGKDKLSNHPELMAELLKKQAESDAILESVKAGETTLDNLDPELWETELDTEYQKIQKMDRVTLRVRWFGTDHWMATDYKFHMWLLFKSRNPEVYTMLVDLLEEYVLATRSKECGMALLWNRLRWEMDLKTEGDSSFKLPNDYAAPYARLIMQKEEYYSNSFETRCSYPRECPICSQSKKNKDRWKRFEEHGEDKE